MLDLMNESIESAQVVWSACNMAACNVAGRPATCDIDTWQTARRCHVSGLASGLSKSTQTRARARARTQARTHACVHIACTAVHISLAGVEGEVRAHCRGARRSGVDSVAVGSGRRSGSQRSLRPTCAARPRLDPCVRGRARSPAAMQPRMPTQRHKCARGFTAGTT